MPNSKAITRHVVGETTSDNKRVCQVTAGIEGGSFPDYQNCGGW